MRASLALLVLLASSGCALRSGLHIDGRTQFALGENQHGAYTASVDNIGSAPVALVLDGQTVAELAPGDAVKQSVAPDSVLTLVNSTRRHARLNVLIRGDKGLSMGYAPAE